MLAANVISVPIGWEVDLSYGAHPIIELQEAIEFVQLTRGTLAEAFEEQHARYFCCQFRV